MGLISIYLCERFGLTYLALYGEGAVFVDGCFSQSAPYYVFNKVSLQIADTVECLQANVTCLKVKKKELEIVLHMVFYQAVLPTTLASSCVKASRE